MSSLSESPSPSSSSPSQKPEVVHRRLESLPVDTRQTSVLSSLLTPLLDESMAAYRAELTTASHEYRALTNMNNQAAAVYRAAAESAKTAADTVEQLVDAKTEALQDLASGTSIDEVDRQVGELEALCTRLETYLRQLETRVAKVSPPGMSLLL